jgi:chromosome segregation ATPase
LFGVWFAWDQWHQNALLRAKNARLQADLKSDESKLGDQAREERHLIADLEQSRAAEQAEIARLSNSLHEAQALGFDHGFQTHEKEEKQKRQAEIQALEANLAQLRAQEQDLQNGGKQAHVDSQANERATRDALGRQIHDLGDKINGEKQQIAQLKKATYDPDSQNRAASMQNDLANDQQTLAYLKSQRDQTGAAFGSQRAQTDAQTRDQLAQAKQGEAAIRAQIDADKAAIKQFDDALGLESRSEKDAQNNQAQLKATIAARQAKVTELDSRIREEKAKLDALGAK